MTRATRSERLLIVTLHYRPEPNFITTSVAETLALRSKVTVVTAHPNYPEGRFYPGTKFWKIQRSVENGVTVWRIPYYTDHSLSAFKRTLSYASFACMATLIAPFVAGRPSVVWVYHGPFMTALAALWFKIAYRARLVYTCADLWPESLVASNLGTAPLVLKALFAYSRWINRAADCLICCTRGTLERYRADGVPANRLVYVPVWVEPSEAAPTRQVADPDSVFRIVYAGNLGPAQPIETLIRAASSLRKEGVALRVDIYGGGSREGELRALSAQEEAANVFFHGRVSPERAFELSALASAQFVALRPSPQFSMTIPSKLSFAMAAGAPLVYGLEGEAANLAKEAGGISFLALEPDSLVAAIKAMMALSPYDRTKMTTRLQEFYREHFDQTKLLRQYESLLTSDPSVFLAQQASDSSGESS